ncbi:MAG: hypothetical protein WAW17_02125, partial [Rhodococcus sp. (in: high G+C Gram-positive bacteria)]
MMVLSPFSVCAAPRVLQRQIQGKSIDSSGGRPVSGAASQREQDTGGRRTAAVVWAVTAMLLVVVVIAADAFGGLLRLSG